MKPLRIGITCYPTVGGSGILASALGEELARRGHEAHFISYERPFRLPADAPRLFFHPVEISDYGLFKYPDYTLPLSVKMAEVTRDCGLDVLHVHYAVPHATAALLARSMLPEDLQPRIVTTLHGTDTTLLGRHSSYAPAIRHALSHSDAITTVSESLRRQSLEHLGVALPIEVIHNFFTPRAPKRPRREVRQELGVGDDEVLILHISNLRPIKRVDLLLEAAARIRTGARFKLLILAGEPFGPFAEQVQALGIGKNVIVRERVNDIEDYLQAADLGLYTSEQESFCLSILEGMCFGVPNVATRVGGIPEVVEEGVSGLLVPFGDADGLAKATERLMENRSVREGMGQASRERARQLFSADVIVPKYEALYRRVCG